MSDAPRRCPECGGPIVARPRESRPALAKRETCSKPCAFALKRRRTRERLGTKTCAWSACGMEFDPTDWERRHPHRWEQRLYCSRECAIGDRTREDPSDLRSALARMGTRTCARAGCGAVFGASEWERRHPKQWEMRKYCSRSCAGRDSPGPPPRRPVPVPSVPAPQRSVFGDRKPEQVWRPAGFSSSPSRS